MKAFLLCLTILFSFVKVSGQKLILKPSSSSRSESPTYEKPDKRLALKPSLTGILRGQLSLSGEYVLNNSFTAELELGLLHKNYLGDFIKDIEGGSSLLDNPFPSELQECELCYAEEAALGFSYAAHFRYFWDYAAFDDVGYLGIFISRRNYRGKYSIDERYLNARPGSGIQVIGFDEKREENFTDLALSLGFQYALSDAFFIDCSILTGYRILQSKGFINNFYVNDTDYAHEFGSVMQKDLMLQVHVKLGFVLF